MSKRNRNKNRFVSPSAPAAAPKSQPEAAQGDTLKKDFLHLGGVILFILALLAGIHYYDQQTGFLQTMTSQLFSLF